MSHDTPPIDVLNDVKMFYEVFYLSYYTLTQVESESLTLPVNNSERDWLYWATLRCECVSPGATPPHNEVFFADIAA